MRRSSSARVRGSWSNALRKGGQAATDRERYPGSGVVGQLHDRLVALLRKTGRHRNKYTPSPDAGVTRNGTC